MAVGRAQLPELSPITAYGNGGFRFAGMSHRGSLLCLPSGIYGWELEAIDDVTDAHFSALFEEAAVSPLPFCLFGTGRSPKRPNLALREAFASRRIGLEIMDTGAAARTFNVLLAEGRRVAAALIAVD